MIHFDSMFVSTTRTTVRRSLVSQLFLTPLCAAFLYAGTLIGSGQGTGAINIGRATRVLIIFSEPKDLPGNALLQRGLEEAMVRDSTNRIDFFTESLDAGRIVAANPHEVFRDYLARKYAGQNLDRIVLFMARDFGMLRLLPTGLTTNCPVVFVAISEQAVPLELASSHFMGIVQRFDIHGTLQFIFQLLPQTRRVIVIGGTSDTDRLTLDRIDEAARSLADIDFEFWTNRPIAELRKSAAALPQGTVVLLGTVQRDATGEAFYTSQVAQWIASSASVPMFVLGAGSIGSGALGGVVIDFDSLGADAGELAAHVSPQYFGSAPPPIEIRTRGTSMVDWRALRRWDISKSRLGAHCVICYRPLTLWEEHKTFILVASLVVLAQAITIAGLVAQRTQRRRAEAEILLQRTELSHVARVSTMGQLASALTHELNQPLGAILRNAEAAELLLDKQQPDLAEVRSILADIRKDDQRAGDVISRMRDLFKRRQLESQPMDIRKLVEDIVEIVRPDANARQVKIALDLPAQLPSISGDRIHLQQVLLNLVLNGMDAVKSCQPGNRLLLVSARGTSDGTLKVSVSDNGTGLPAEAINRIFEPFFTTKSDGMGMGLAISRTIVEAHGGRIHGENRPGGGAVFSFVLPVIQKSSDKSPGRPGGMGT